MGVTQVCPTVLSHRNFAALSTFIPQRVRYGIPCTCFHLTSRRERLRAPRSSVVRGCAAAVPCGERTSRRGVRSPLHVAATLSLSDFLRDDSFSPRSRSKCDVVDVNPQWKCSYKTCRFCSAIFHARNISMHSNLFR